MASYRLTKTADKKIAVIYEYSLQHFGEAQADTYFLGMHGAFHLLADRPDLGRPSAELGEGVRRFLYRSYILFYKSTSYGILVLDIFGVRQDIGNLKPSR
jgi:toxin ParE1/3/4